MAKDEKCLGGKKKKKRRLTIPVPLTAICRVGEKKRRLEGQRGTGHSHGGKECLDREQVSAEIEVGKKKGGFKEKKLETRNNEVRGRKKQESPSRDHSC